MMSQVIRQETVVFLLAVGHGGMLALFYDFLRAFRRAVPHSCGAVSAEDFLFWILAGFLTFCLLFRETNGEIRGYVAVGIGLGVALYLLLLSRLVLAVFAVVFHFFHLVLSPIETCRKKAVAVWHRGSKKIGAFIRKKQSEKEEKRIEIPVEKGYNKNSVQSVAGRRYKRKKRAEKRELGVTVQSCTRMKR